MFVPEKIDIILGDVNINALDDETFPPPKNILNGYEMVVREPTHLDRGLLDHVYIHKVFLSCKNNLRSFRYRS